VSARCTDSAGYERGKQLTHGARSNASLSTVLVVAGSAALIAPFALVQGATSRDGKF
jgi:hypothetical protein